MIYPSILSATVEIRKKNRRKNSNLLLHVGNNEKKRRFRRINLRLHNFLSYPPPLSSSEVFICWDIMATEAFRPQDCLIDRIRVPPAACPRRRYGGNAQDKNNDCNGRFNRRPVRSEQRKRFGSTQVDRSVSRRSRSVNDLKSVRNNMMMERVTILRRGESLDWTIQERKAGLIASGPGPEMASRQSRIRDVTSDVYAGSAFVVSPAPSSLPLPSFSKKKQISVDDLATRDLRRLLGLNL